MGTTATTATTCNIAAQRQHAARCAKSQKLFWPTRWSDSISHSRARPLFLVLSNVVVGLAMVPSCCSGDKAATAAATTATATATATCDHGAHVARAFPLTWRDLCQQTSAT